MHAPWEKSKKVKFKKRLYSDKRVIKNKKTRTCSLPFKKNGTGSLEKKPQQHKGKSGLTSFLEKKAFVYISLFQEFAGSIRISIANKNGA